MEKLYFSRYLRKRKQVLKETTLILLQNYIEISYLRMPLNRANVEKMKAKLEDMEDDKNQREGLFINSNEKALAKINLFISTAINMLAEERFTE